MSCYNGSGVVDVHTAEGYFDQIQKLIAEIRRDMMVLPEWREQQLMEEALVQMERITQNILEQQGNERSFKFSEE